MSLQRIDADLLLPGRGDPIPDGTVVLDGDRITYAGPRAQAPATPDVQTTTARTVMPGLWECHGHFVGARAAELRTSVTAHPALLGARCAGDAAAALRAGITSVREVGGVGVHLARAIEEGTVVGPRIYGANAILSTTGGHGDIHDLPLSWVHDYTTRGGFLRVCDGEAEVVRAVREQLRTGAEVIKVCASGGVMSELDDPIHQQFTIPELRAAVEIAGMADRIVAAHCHGEPGIMAALESGVRTIEHGTYLTDDSCQAMVEADAILVPTRTVVVTLLEHGKAHDMPAWALRKLEAVADRHAEGISCAIANGVTIAAGTDTWMSGSDLPLAWGDNGRELALLADLGMTPLQAVEAATANGPATLGPRGRRSGLLAADHDADVITLDADPLADLSILAGPGHVTGVWVGGRRLMPG